MALLAPQDWHPPRDRTMDLPAQNNSIPRQRSSPANDHSPSTSPPVPTPPNQPTPPPQQQAQQPYPYPVQQQPQGGWTPSIAAQPFYPSFYQNQNQQQQAYNLHGHSPHTTPGQIPQQNPYFDPAANAQLAQWAYQQMMFNAQHQAHQMQQQHVPRNAPNTTADYFAQNHLAGFNAFPSGTPPPPHPSNHAHSFSAGAPQRNGSGDQYGGFHPYRRPTRQASSNSQESDWRAAPFQPPYGRADAASSSTSVNSQSSYSGGGPRPRTNSNQTSSSNGHSNGTKHKLSASSSSTRSRPGVPPPANARTRSGSNSSSSSGQAPQRPHLHHRNTSSSSSSSASNTTTTTPRPSISSTTSTVTSASTSSSSQSLGVLPKARPVRRSPLSQGTFTAAEKRMSRDDSDIAAMMESSPNASALRGGGLKGRLRRALSLNASQTLGEEKHLPMDEEEDDDASIKATASGRILPTSSGSKPPVPKLLPGMTGDTESTATVQTKKKSRAASLFNSRLNASTDNISLSSTVSSASVMIRKLGSMGNLARRNSLAGITSLFKDKKDKHKDGDEGGGSKKDKKKKKGEKGEAAEASISHATAEVDRSSDWSVGGEMSGLSPAAKLARQHTLKSNAEAAARAKAQQESAASASAQEGASVNGASPVPETWEKNTATGAVRSPARTGSGGVARVNEDGTRVLVEDDSGSEDGSGDGTYDGHQGSSIIEGWDDDEDWGDGADDQDATIRVSMERTNLDESDDTEMWAANLRRSMERVRVPTKGILKHAASYDQQAYLADHTNSTFNRARANSDNSHPSHNVELGPLARISSPDPDHIDGLSRHPSHSSQHGPAKSSFLPTLPFESTGDLGTDSPKRMDSGRSSPNPPEKAIFNHPNFNSSAPTLSTMVNPNPLTLTHRSATAPAKRLVFANNLSVYDTFSSSVYDRRSEPATWSRLTPALAQRIKEELNSYKMEEMEVHAASRIHTQFFV